MKTKHTLLVLLLFTTMYGTTQNIAINSNGSNPDSSAMLDIASTSKGLLMPRMTAAQKNAISLPATGLLIYQTDGTSGYYFYNGSVWQNLANASAYLPLTGGILSGNLIGTSAAFNNTLIVGALTYPNTDGTNGQVLTTNGNGTLSWGSSQIVSDSNYNTAGGTDALVNGGHESTAFGYSTLQNAINNNDVEGNSAFGSLALQSTTSGSFNDAFGAWALQANTTGSSNTAMGYNSLHTNVAGGDNTALGNNADVSSDSLTNATAIGSHAVVDASNKIQLGNNDVTLVSTNGAIKAGTITYPNTDGDSAQVLTTNGNGILNWTTPTVGATQLSELSDIDGSGGVDKNAGNILIADGSKFVSVSMNGGASLSSTGALTISAGSISSTELANNSVTTAKIDDGTITNNDINSNAAIAYSKLNLANSIVGNDITSNAITGAKIADSTIGITKLSATGTKSASTYLRGDGTWDTPAGGTSYYGFAANTSGSTIAVVLGGTDIPMANSQVFNGVTANGSNTVFTVANAGTYRIDYNISTTANLLVSSRILINGSTSVGVVSPSVSINKFQSFVIVNLSANDQIKVQFYGLIGAAVLAGHAGISIQKL